MLKLVAALLGNLLILSATPTTSAGGNSDYPESTVCGVFREATAFWLWSRLAGSPDPARLEGLANAQEVSHRTRDDRLLRGYKLNSTASGGRVRGSLLMAGGNAMLADQLLPELRDFAAAGIEPYVFDYRGYGRSEGKPRLQAIIGDYLELFAAVAPADGGERHLYGISFGGVVLLNVAGRKPAFDRMVIDSSPARVSPYGCPEDFDPTAQFPEDGTGIMVIAGGRDRVVPLEDVRELLVLARERGGQGVVEEQFAHPFMDTEAAIRRQRAELILSFITAEPRQGVGP